MLIIPRDSWGGAYTHLFKNFVTIVESIFIGVSEEFAGSLLTQHVLFRTLAHTASVTEPRGKKYLGVVNAFEGRWC